MKEFSAEGTNLSAVKKGVERFGGYGNPHNSSALLLLNDAIPEPKILGKCSRYEVKGRLRPYNTLVRNKRMRRVVVSGTVYYVPVKEMVTP